jgi:hypothetical protein
MLSDRPQSVYRHSRIAVESFVRHKKPREFLPREATSANSKAGHMPFMVAEQTARSQALRRVAALFNQVAQRRSVKHLRCLLNCDPIAAPRWPWRSSFMQFSSRQSNPTGSQRVAGGRSTAETPGSGEGWRHPEGMPEPCDPSRVDEGLGYADSGGVSRECGIDPRLLSGKPSAWHQPMERTNQSAHRSRVKLLSCHRCHSSVAAPRWPWRWASEFTP